MCPNDPPPDRPVFGNASAAGDPAEIRYLTRFEMDRNDESGFVTAVRVTLSARASAAYRAEVAEALRAMYAAAEVTVV